MRACGNCDRPIPTGAHGLRKWCSDACRYRARPVTPSRRGACSDCGKSVFVTHTSAAQPRCHECRRRGRSCEACGRVRCQCVKPDDSWVCEWCGAECTRKPARGQVPKYCNKTCAGRASLARRAAVRGEFDITRAQRRKIYERDGWTCQICGLPTSEKWSHGDPWSPSLDHIVPQSATLIPDHSPSNLRLTHWRCNQLRGADVRTDEEIRELVRAEV